MIDRTTLLPLIIISMSALVLFNINPQQQLAFGPFYSFKKDFTKSYSSDAEQFYRKTVFLQNWVKIQTHNSDPSNTHELGVNQFADLTEQEFIENYLGTRSGGQEVEVDADSSDLSSVSLHKYGDIDWVANGHVSGVRNQGICGSCWAFSTTGSIQSAYSIFRSQKVKLSEQQLVDCSSSYGNHGCSGGWMDSGFAYVIDRGLSTDVEYPYRSRVQTCQKNQGAYKVRGFTKVPQCTNLHNALQQRPVSVSVDASKWALYRQGVLSICGENANHGVLLVGATDNYWKIKNSWGVNWGEDGYIRIARGNTCAVCSYPSYPFL